jgi:hypothetical protein
VAHEIGAERDSGEHGRDEQHEQVRAFGDEQAELVIHQRGHARLGDAHQGEAGGSKVSLDEVLKRAPSNWYLEAEEARDLGLIEAVL